MKYCVANLEEEMQNSKINKLRGKEMDKERVVTGEFWAQDLV